MLACCGVEKHEWDRLEVERCWLPPTLRCFVVGENPGDTKSEYFYERPASYAADEVVVRGALLGGLHQQGLIAEATLEGFWDAGFLFDHAIRCQLSSKVVRSEREKATRYASRRLGNAHQGFDPQDGLVNLPDENRRGGFTAVDLKNGHISSEPDPSAVSESNVHAASRSPDPECPRQAWGDHGEGRACTHKHRTEAVFSALIWTV